MIRKLFLFVTTIVFCYSIKSCFGEVLCEDGYCSDYLIKNGCPTTHQHCNFNNATHSGQWMASATECNCCQICMPYYGNGEVCTTGGPGTGVTIGRCGYGLTCVEENGGSFCRRMNTTCQRAQDDYDERHMSGHVGALELRPICDYKGRYHTSDCVPTQTCFCQSDHGERLFGEVLNIANNVQNLHCGCSKLHHTIKTSISPAVRLPIVGPRCTSDGNFYPIQCIHRECHCVNAVTGERQGVDTINLDTHPISRLSCYNRDLDLFPEQSHGNLPYNFTTPCYESMERKIQQILKSEEEGYNVDFFSEVPECSPDGTFGRIAKTANGSKICVNEFGVRIGDYEARSDTSDYNNMDCKCALTSSLMLASPEKPVCCRNGNFRRVQCRRGTCYCVDGDGRQIGQEKSNVGDLQCFTNNWRTC